MSDDIPTRLRMFSLDDGTDALNKLLAEAADDIERLRKAISDLIGPEMCDPNDPCEMCKE